MHFIIRCYFTHTTSFFFVHKFLSIYHYEIDFFADRRVCCCCTIFQISLTASLSSRCPFAIRFVSICICEKLCFPVSISLRASILFCFAVMSVHNQSPPPSPCLFQAPCYIHSSSTMVVPLVLLSTDTVGTLTFKEGTPF